MKSYLRDVERYYELIGNSEPVSPFMAVLVGLINPKIMPVGIFRISSWLHEHKIPFLPKLFTLLNIVLFGVEITPRTQIEGGLFLPHPNSIVIGAFSIGKNATIYQGVTLGAKFLDMGFDPNTRPKVGDDVVIGSGAKVLGGINIGNNVLIGANALASQDIPSNRKLYAAESVLI